MAEELINFDLPVDCSSIIKVIGVGGGGNNAVNYMFRQGIKDVNFVVCNTDAQALVSSPVGVKVQLGASLTEGRGAGNKPEIGRQAAMESIEDITEILSKNTKMVFITAGMGGGTGTGAAPIIAKVAKEMGLLTVAIVTLPFGFEGKPRMEQAISGINELKGHVDSLLIINNEKLREVFGNLVLSQAFGMADNVLACAAKGIAEIITVHGYINVDFADVQTIMANSGIAIMGSGTAEGEDRALNAIQQALRSPLLNNNDITGAKSILLNITSGIKEITMDEVGVITDFVNNSVSRDALMIWGTGVDAQLENKISVTIIATGFNANSIPELQITKHKNEGPVRFPLEGESKKGIINIQARTNYEPYQQKLDFKIVDRNGMASASSDKLTEVDIRMNTSTPAEKVDGRKSAGRKPITEEKPSIEDLENIPAYLRKNVNIEQTEKTEGNISKYSLSTDEDNKMRLRQNNSFLFDNVD